MQVCWSITPLILTAIFVIAGYYWKTPVYGGAISGEDTVHYPEWVHYVGWALTGIVVIQIPLAAIVMAIYYAVIKRDCLGVFKPTSDWGPGDKEARREWIAYKYSQATMCKQHPYASYDNYAMSYPPPAAPHGYYPTTGGGHLHM